MSALDGKEQDIMRCRRPSTFSFFVAIVSIVAVSLFASGCGGGGTSPGVASVASSTTPASTTTTQNGVVAFSACMRSNGVTDFPDLPRVGGRSVKAAVARLQSRNPQHFRTAMNACRHLLPNGGPQEPTQQTRTQLADELSFARCMRSHGVSRFPDPTVQSGLTVEMVRAQGIDVRAPAVLRVVQACLPASHGGLTLKRVREALDHAGG